MADAYMPEDDRSQNSDLVNAQPQTAEALSAPGYLDRFLENIYGALFAPQATFANLRSHPSIPQAVGAIVLVNILEALRTGQYAKAIPLNAIFGLLGWVLLAAILHRLASVFKLEVGFASLLTPIAFGSMPWIFIGPALSLGGTAGATAAIVVTIWFTVWQIWATAVAIQVRPWRLLTLIPLTVLGGIVAAIWFANTIVLLVGFGQSN